MYRRICSLVSLIMGCCVVWSSFSTLYLEMHKETSLWSVDVESGKMFLFFCTHSECAYIQLQKEDLFPLHISFFLWCNSLIYSTILKPQQNCWRCWLKWHWIWIAVTLFALYQNMSQYFVWRTLLSATTAFLPPTAHKLFSQHRSCTWCLLAEWNLQVYITRVI